MGWRRPVVCSRTVARRADDQRWGHAEAAAGVNAAGGRVGETKYEVIQPLAKRQWRCRQSGRYRAPKIFRDVWPSFSRSARAAAEPGATTMNLVRPHPVDGLQSRKEVLSGAREAAFT